MAGSEEKIESQPTQAPIPRWHQRFPRLTRLIAATGLAASASQAILPNAEARNLSSAEGVTSQDLVNSSDYSSVNNTSIPIQALAPGQTPPENAIAIPLPKSAPIAVAVAPVPAPAPAESPRPKTPEANQPFDMANSQKLTEFYTSVSQNIQTIPGITKDQYVAKLGMLKETKVQGDGSILYTMSNGGRVMTRNGVVVFESEPITVLKGKPKPTIESYTSKFGPPEDSIPGADFILNLGENGVTKVYPMFAVVGDVSTGEAREIQVFTNMTAVQYKGSYGSLIAAAGRADFKKS